jgi:LacI family transcriptional regulator
MKELNLPVGFHCETDFIGVELCRVAREHGFEVPYEIAVLGQCDYRVARCSIPPLSSFPLGGNIGYRMMDLLDRCLNRDQAIPLKTLLPAPPIKWRESTGGGDCSLGYIQRAHQYIDEHSCEGIRVSDVAALMSVAPKTLTKGFQRAMGCTPGEAIRHARLQYAKNYLASTDMSVADISGLCGYNQQSKFSKFFKRETEMTPLEYRDRFGK